MTNFEIDQSLASERVDTALARLLGISRSQAAGLCEAGAVTRGKITLAKSDRLNFGDRIRVEEIEQIDPLEIVARDVSELKIVFQDADIIVIDKPSGVVSHPSVGFDGPTVAGVLLARGITLSTSGAQERQGIVQRLDVGTSGLMVLAKSERAYSVLKQAFRDRAVKKIYHALVQGHLDPASGTIDAPIGRHPKAEFKFAVMDSGKPSITHYETLEVFPGATLCEVNLETGRTHQIRVHFAAFRHPLVGDTMYGADPRLGSRLGLERQWLHAMELSFAHPISGEQLRFESSYPKDLAEAVERLRV
ncbi:MAG: RluA family pseudouridine synthase [Actinomycetota bacterium]